MTSGVESKRFGEGKIPDVVDQQARKALRKGRAVILMLEWERAYSHSIVAGGLPLTS